jgi:hypothetical protein
MLDARCSSFERSEQSDAAITPSPWRGRRRERPNKMKDLLSLLLVFVFCSCANHSESDKTLNAFDSINNSLKEINSKYDQSSSSLYDSLRKKFSASRLGQFEYTISGYRRYLQELQTSFKTFCGDRSGAGLPADSEDNISLTNRFFGNKQGAARHLLPQLKQVQKICLDNTNNPVLQEEINNMVRTPPGKNFIALYFYNAPPIAVLTILSKFANDINNIEHKILQEQLNK